MAKKLARKSTSKTSRSAAGASRSAKPAAKSAKNANRESRTANRESRTASRGRKYVYFFGDGKADGDRTMKDLLGGKGSGLAEMTNAGLPVPPGFTIST